MIVGATNGGMLIVTLLTTFREQRGSLDFFFTIRPRFFSSRRCLQGHHPTFRASCHLSLFPKNSDFPIENIPFGIISTSADPSHRAATIVGDHVVDIRELAVAGLFDGPLLKEKAVQVFSQPVHPSAPFVRVRALKVKDSKELQAKAILAKSLVQNHLPSAIGDYTDFYASKEHATNVGIMFRGRENALMPNWFTSPVGYHGRASSVVVSGTPLRRPCGLIQDPVSKAVSFSPSKKLDYEVEVAFFIGVGNELGDRIDISNAEEHIFGMVLMNDWSARDIQAFEYVPLGPFLGKNFGTTISPWIVTMDALEPFRVPQPHQQLAHHTVNGCNARAGDLCASGTISGEEKTSVGSLLEASVNGKEPLELVDAASGKSFKRTFIEDGDTIVMTGFARKLLWPKGWFWRVQRHFASC
ncbi:hypothetical protein BC829DRAFT_412474 [Chytridium lagenaria]|nr:hypothetical protein BC829DRAFT_412474 [Chytridium lagenaria]